ncbi:hypothetical protein, partial [Streptomyces sp. sk2.1]|uniref:hypothetical protein n=1 Tax=Streptomyces sp. sk2.1 TaxID=2478959 RepID=UPI001CA309C9
MITAPRTGPRALMDRAAAGLQGPDRGAARSPGRDQGAAGAEFSVSCGGAPPQETENSAPA